LLGSASNPRNSGSGPFLPSLSIIVAAYNVQDTIESCLQSILALEYPPTKVEVIIVDNASTDQTAAILSRYSRRLKILRETTRGSAAARNRGLFQAEGEVIAFTDADCIVDARWARGLVAPLQDARVGIVGGKILAKAPCNRIEEFGNEIHDHQKAIEVYQPPYVCTGNWASRLSVLQEGGFFDERFLRSQDVDLSYRILQAGYSFCYVPGALVFHQNESTLAGLFHEGCVHGYYSVPLLKKHRQFLKQYKHRRVNLNDFLALGRDMVDCAFGKDRQRAMCNVSFNGGKRIGKICGSLRFGTLEL
jgi:O-antigen biosynthesis protein